MKFYIFLLRSSIIFYLCPFQVIKYLLPLEVVEQFSDAGIVYKKTIDVVNYICARKIDGNYIIYPSYIPLIYTVCLLLFSICTIVTWYQYFKSYRELLLSSDILDNDMEKFIDDNPQFIGLKKKSFCVFEQERITTPFTVGFSSPCIVFPKCNLTQKQREFIYSHELTHILHHDVTWKALCTMAVLLHWYNPLVHLLRAAHSSACEYYADEYCTSFMSKEEKKEYISLIVQFTSLNVGSIYDIPNFSNSFIGGKKSMKKRIDFIFKERKMRKLRQIASAVCICLVFLMSSMTVFAYSPSMQDSTSLEASSSKEELIVTWSTDDADSLPIDLDFSKYSSYFVDKDGNVTPLLEDDDAAPNALCFHTYVDGYKEIHKKFSDGHCEIRHYAAQICSKCKACITGELEYTTTWTKCSHKF